MMVAKDILDHKVILEARDILVVKAMQEARDTLEAMVHLVHLDTQEV